MAASVHRHPVTGEELWPTGQAAAYLGVSRSTLLRHEGEWGLVAIQRREGAHRRFTESSVRAAVPRVWPDREPGDPGQ